MKTTGWGFRGSQAFLQRKYGNLIRAWRQALSQTDSMASWLPKKRRAPISNQGFDWAFNKGYKGLFGLRMITDSFPVCGKSIWIQKTHSQRDQNLIILPVGGRLLHFVKRVGNPTCTCDISAIFWIIWIRIRPPFGNPSRFQPLTMLSMLSHAIFLGQAHPQAFPASHGHGSGLIEAAFPEGSCTLGLCQRVQGTLESAGQG